MPFAELYDHDFVAPRSLHEGNLASADCCVDVSRGAAPRPKSSAWHDKLVVSWATSNPATSAPSSTPSSRLPSNYYSTGRPGIASLQPPYVTTPTDSRNIITAGKGITCSRCREILPPKETTDNTPPKRYPAEPEGSISPHALRFPLVLLVAELVSFYQYSHVLAFPLGSANLYALKPIQFR